MKIGIITIQKCNNFGADLQAYALGAKLRAMGHDAENIDYLFYKHPRHVGGKMERPVLPISLKNRVKEILFPIVAAVRGLRNSKRRRERAAKFARWFAANVKVGGEYRSVESLYDNPPLYDVYMVGSDQVWNPRLYSNIAPYFLDFAPNDAKCVSYASSFGIDELSGPVFYKYKQWLKRFSHIGLREKGGEEIVRAMALDAHVEHVLDPTLLLTADEWASVASEPDVKPAGKYLLLYDLIASTETVELARRWANDNGWEIMRVGDDAYGPGEFIWLFAHAEAIVTNSFHGTVFSILHHKLFYSVVPRGMMNAGRIESLVSQVGLASRLLNAEAVDRVNLELEINYGAVDGRLNELRCLSESFLKNAITGGRPNLRYNLPLGCYVAWNNNDEERESSTSGGIFKVLANRTIESGGVVFGAIFDADFRHVRHVAAESIGEIAPLMRSKYVWSDPTQAYRDAVSALTEGRDVLFVGTPCQIAALKKMARGQDENLMTIDIVCHGTPRADMFASYIEELEKRCGGKCIDYNFRDKHLGWNFPCVDAKFSTGKRYNMVLRSDPWYLGFALGATLRKTCFACPYVSLERVADFTIADCWRVAASNPKWDDNKGTSMVFVNTSKAVKTWKGLVAAGEIKYGVYDLDIAQMRNMPLMQKAHLPSMYEDVQKIFDETKSFHLASSCFVSNKLMWRARLVFWIKRIGWFYFKGRQ